MSPRTVPIITRTIPSLRSTSICLGVGYGSRHDPVTGGGLAHLLEHMLMSSPLRGTSLIQRVEVLGGQSNAETGLEKMLFYAQVDARDVAEIVPLLLEAVLAPQLTPAELDTERGAVLLELAAAAADPSDVVQDAFLETLFPGHPLARPVGGTEAELATIDIDTVMSVHLNDFLARPMALAVVGPHELDLEPATVDVAARETERQPLASPPVREPEWPEAFAWLCLGGRSAPRGESHAFTVLAQLLGSSPASPLYQRLRRDNSLSYTFGSWDRGYTEAGAFRTLVGCEAAHCDAVVTEVRETLLDVVKGNTGEVLAAARRQAQMKLIMEVETPLEHAKLLAKKGVEGCPEWTLDAELAALDAVTAQDVGEAARQVLDTFQVVVRS